MLHAIGFARRMQQQILSALMASSSQQTVRTFYLPITLTSPLPKSTLRCSACPPWPPGLGSLTSITPVHPRSSSPATRKKDSVRKGLERRAGLVREGRLHFPERSYASSDFCSALLLAKPRIMALCTTIVLQGP